MKRLLLTLTLLPLTHIAPAQAPASVDSVLKQMDAASRTFKNARADFEWRYYEKVVHDTSIQRGSIYFERTGASTSMGALVSAPGAKVLEYHGGTLQMFDPGVNQITVLDAGANQTQYESFLTLGFGGSGSDLAKAWTITDGGPETMDDNGKPVKVEKLDLVSKEASVRNTFTHVTIWVDPARAISLKQLFFTPSGDSRTALYSHVVINGSLDRGKFAIKKNKTTTVIHR